MCFGIPIRCRSEFSETIGFHLGISIIKPWMHSTPLA
jgi:hypothetical protein